MAPAAIATFLQRLAAGLGGSRQSAAVPQLRALASLRCLSPPAHGIERSGAALRPSALPQRPPRGRRAAAAARRLLHVTAASYSVITGDSSSSSGDASSGGGDFGCQPWMLIVYSKAGCHLCEGLKEKLEALLERAAFMPSLLSTAELEVRDITTQPDWEQRYAMTIPVLAAAAADGSGEVEVPRPSPRLTADALQKHIEKFLAACQQQ